MNPISNETSYLLKSANTNSRFFRSVTCNSSINIQKLNETINGLQLLTLPYVDKKGNQINLWNTFKYGLVASVLTLEGELVIIPQKNIYSPLGQQNGMVSFGNHFSSGMLLFDFVYDISKISLTIWPHLEAAGKGERVRDIRIKGSPLRFTSEEALIKLIQSHGYVKKDGDPNAWVNEMRGVEIHIDRPGEGNNIGEPRHVDLKLHDADRKLPLESHFLTDKVKKRAAIDSRYENQVYQPSRSQLEEDKRRWRREDYISKLKDDLKNKIKNGNLSSRDIKKEEYAIDKEKKRLEDRERKYAEFKLKWRFVYGEEPPGGGYSGDDEGSHLEGDPAQKNFRQTLQQTRLTSSYNSCHPNNPIPAKGGTGGEIGGVACGVNYIEGLFDHLDDLFERAHYFCLPELYNGEPPFSNEQLKQILRELAIAIYTHGAIPFFSLHFRQGSADLFPVIHPAYANTLVGRVIGLLDYFMKGYLNGGVYTEDFIDEWHKDPNWNTKSENSFEKLISFAEYCHRNLDEEDSYFSVNDLLEFTNSQGFFEKIFNKINDALTTNPEDPYFENFDGFRNSFRIIAKQKSYQKEHDVFFIDGDFDVEYTIEPSPAYKEALVEYERKYGVKPTPYLRLVAVYEEMSRRIHDHMVKMPLCREYFSMLNVINFFSSYFSTLKQHRKIPVLPPLKLFTNPSCPPLFPYLPIHRVNQEPIEINPFQILNTYINNYKIPLKKFLEALFRALIHQSIQPDKILQFQTEERGILEEYLTREVKNNIFSYRSAAFKRYFRKNNLLDLPASQLSPDLFKLLMIPFSKFDFANNSHEFNNIDYENTIDNILSITVKRISNQKININQDDIPYPSTLNISELEEAEKNKQKNVVGGCGMKLTTQFIQQSEKAKEILYFNWDKLEVLVPEIWKKVKFENNRKGVVFRLQLEDVPPELIDNYAWMESLLLVDEKDTLDDVEERLAIEQALIDKDEAKFKEFVYKSSDIKRMRDRQGKTLLHFAALVENPFYLQTLLDLDLDIKAEDVQGYLPIHYAAMKGCLQNIEVLLRKDPNLLNKPSKNGSTPLVVAIQNHQLETVRFFITKNAYCANLAGGYTELHCALHERNQEILTQLLKSQTMVNKCINVCCEEGGTALMMSCEFDLEECTKMLLDHGADVNIKRHDGVTASEIAIRHNYMPTLHLLAPRANLSAIEFEAVAKEGSLETIQLVAQFSRDFYSYTSSCKDTLLHIALRSGNLTAAKHFIEYTYDLDKENIEGETAFSLAVALGAWDLVYLLYQKNVRFDPAILLRSSYSMTANKILNALNPSEDELQRYLFIAAQAGNYEIISQFLEPRGVDLEAFRDSKGGKLIHSLAKADGIYLFKRILFKTMDLMQPLGQDGNKTLVYIAAENGSKNILTYLIGALKHKNLPLENHFYDKHLFYAVINSGLEDCVKLMLDTFKEANLVHSPLDDNGSYAIHLAAKLGALGLLKMLKEYGADLNVKDAAGYTPLYYATRANHSEAVKFLIDHQVFVDGKALCFSAQKGFEKIFQSLIDTQPMQESLDRALYESIRQNQFFSFLRLQALGAKPCFIDAEGWTPTLLAAYQGQVQFLKAILMQGEVDQSYIKGNNALHLACERGHVDCVELLLKVGFMPQSNLEKTAYAKDHSLVHLVLKNNILKTKLIKEEFLMALNKCNPAEIERTISFIGPHEKFCMSDLSDYSGTVLHHLLNQEDIQNIKGVIKKLLNNKRIQPNLSDSHGNTLAHLLLKKKKSPLKLVGINLRAENHEGQTPLHLAVVHADKSVVEELLDQLPLEDINKPDHKGKTPLHYVIQHFTDQRIEILSLLIERGANLAQRDYRLITPLFLACQKGLFKVVRLLLEGGANPNQTATLERILPLHLALIAENLEMARLLLFHGADANRLSPDGTHLMHVLAKKGNEQLFRLLAAKGGLWSSKTKLGLESIHYAAERGHIGILSMLKNRGVSLNEPIETSLSKNELSPPELIVQGMTPLHLAIKSGHKETVEWLLDNKSDVSIETKTGRNALSFAASSPISKELLNIFSQYRISRDVDSVQKAALYAILDDNLDAVKILYNTGLTIHTPINGEDHGLHVASRCGALQCTSWLLQNGADPLSCGNRGKNAFELSAKNRSYAQFKLLLEFAQPDLDAVNLQGNTLMHIAAKAGNLKHVMVLILNNAELDVPNNYGLTPLHMATQAGHLKMIHLLLLCGADDEALTFHKQKAIDLIKEKKAEILHLFEQFKNIQIENSEQTRVHHAVRTHFPSAVTLFSRLENINAQDCQGFTPLHMAVQDKQMDCILRLLRAGAQVNIPDHQGHTALWYACLQNQDLATVKMLMRSEADPYFKEDSGLSIFEQVQNSNLLNKNALIEILSKTKSKKLKERI